MLLTFDLRKMTSRNWWTDEYSTYLLYNQKKVLGGRIYAIDIVSMHDRLVLHGEYAFWPRWRCKSGRRRSVSSVFSKYASVVNIISIA